MKSLSPYNLKLSQYQKVSIQSLSPLISKQIKELLLKSKLNINNQDINLTTTSAKFGGLRYWIECPKCKKAKGNLYLVGDGVVCRSCLI